MSANSWLTWLVIAGCITACSTTPETQSNKQVVDIPLAASPQNKGEVARATLAAQGDETGMLFFISGVPTGTTLPVRLYTYIYPGSCGALGAKPAYEMNKTVITDRLANEAAGLTLSRKAPVALNVLRSNGYAIVVRTSPQDGHLDIFCGNIT